MTTRASPWTKVGPAVDRALHDIFDPAAKPYSLGILFVHGMGEQERGDTITQMGDALTEWLRKWLANKPESDFWVREATLRGGAAIPSGTPAHAVSGRAHVSVVLCQGEVGQRTSQEWLLAESWWADAFRPASFSELVAWAIAVGPWLIASQAAGLSQRYRLADAQEKRALWRRVVDLVVGGLLVLLAAVVASVITPLAVGLLILSLIPIPFVSEAIRGLVRNLSGSFGDLLVLVRSPVRFAAMAERVRDDIDWVDSLCDRVMVVAHSQGSAVAWHAIRRTAQEPIKERARIDLFVSFGQAFRKLKSLHRVHTRVKGLAQVAFAGLALGSTLVLLLAASQGLTVVGTLIANGGDVGDTWDEASFSIIATIVSAVLVADIQWLLGILAGANDRRSEKMILEDLAEVRRAYPDFRWTDLWASADPAPNGPLFTEPVDGVHSFRIRNLASTTLDHSVYWSNVTEFVSAVAFAAASLVPSNPVAKQPMPHRLRRASNVREGRVSMLAVARVAVFGALVAAIVGLQHELPDIGNRILVFVDALPLLPDWFQNWRLAAKGWVAAALMMAVTATVWLVLLWAWHAVIRVDERAFFDPNPQPDWTWWARLWITVSVAVPTAVALWVAGAQAEGWPLLVYVVIVILGLLVVLVLLRGHEPRLGDPKLQRPKQAANRSHRAREARKEP